MKKILVTGADGFIGKNLVLEINSIKDYSVIVFDKGQTVEDLRKYMEYADFVCHLAGVNRPSDANDYRIGNEEFTQLLLDIMEEKNKKIPFLFASSIQASENNLYGQSKYNAEKIIIQWSKRNEAPALIYRLPNVFGKWSVPNYNSVIATFCHNIIHSIPIEIHDAEKEITLVYIDDVVKGFIAAIKGEYSLKQEFYNIETSYQSTVGELSEILLQFQIDRIRQNIPDMKNDLIKKLYSTYISYLPPELCARPLIMNKDKRGSFSEFIHTPDRGQVSINISKPGITKGGHWHHSKTEKFLVVSGQAAIELKNIVTDALFVHVVDETNLTVIEIPAGYSHSITNIGEKDLVTVIWANEVFDQESPDTYYGEV